MIQNREMIGMAIEGYRIKANEILATMANLQSMLDGPTPISDAPRRRGRPALISAPLVGKPTRKRRKLTATARRAISLAQKARHEKAREEKAAAVVNIGKRGRRRAA